MEKAHFRENVKPRLDMPNLSPRKERILWNLWSENPMTMKYSGCCSAMPMIMQTLIIGSGDQSRLFVYLEFGAWTLYVLHT
jgi:hypothetical protein